MEIFFGKALVTENIQVTSHIFSIKLTAPEIAHRFRPGQFIMLRIPGHRDPLLGRPLAVFQTLGTDIQVLYAVVGKATTLFQKLQNHTQLEIWGPLGNGFPDLKTEHLILLAGGIGYSPLRSVSEKYQTEHPETKKITLLMGAQTAAALDTYHLSKFYVSETFLATDDGSTGHAGFVTDLLPSILKTSLEDGLSPVVMACGPSRMLQKTTEITASFSVPCYVSLETPMACGMGICFTCVTKRRDAQNEKGWDYCRTCVNGPVFNAQDIIFS